MHPPAPQQRLGMPGRITQVVTAVGLAMSLAGLLLAWAGGPGALAVSPAATPVTEHPPIVQQLDIATAPAIGFHFGAVANPCRAPWSMSLVPPQTTSSLTLLVNAPLHRWGSCLN